LRLLRMAHNRPLLLAIMARFDIAEARIALRLLVSWAVRSLIVGGVGGGTLERHYSERAKGLSDGQLHTGKKLAEAMAVVVPTDAQFESAFSAARVSQSYLARYYLCVLERHSQAKAYPELVPNQNEEELTLEHVLPRNPSPAWGDLDSETAEAYHKRIGNLALLQKPINSAIGNEGFAAKQSVFAASGLVLTRELAQFEAWGPVQIDERQVRLAKSAVLAWQLHP
jgi:hypothetical protein